MRTPRVTPWLWAAGLAAAVGVLALGVRGACFPGRAFDPDVWRAEYRTDAGARDAMAARLAHRGTLVGMTRAEVVDMLGEPVDPSDESELRYELDTTRGLLPVYYTRWLVIHPSHDGRVARCELRESDL